MCILFIFNGEKEAESDYSLILISNRDEYYERPSQYMASWSEDHSVYGGLNFFLAMLTCIFV